MEIVVVGGSDAAISAGLRARELEPNVRVKLLVADRYANFSICGIPYWFSGEVTDWQSLAHRTTAEIEKEGLELLFEHRATSIDAERKTVTAIANGESRTLPYDKLVIGTGATPIAPRIGGIDSPGVFVLHTMDDMLEIGKYIDDRSARSVLIVGGGYIGIEMADALASRGLDTLLVEAAPTVLQTVDPALGIIVGEELARHGVHVTCNVRVQTITVASDGRLAIHGSAGFETVVDLAVVAVGVKPATELAQTAGVMLGVSGAIAANRRMETSVADVYAAGDCIETWHRLLERPTYVPLGTTAHKQGRIAGENAVGGNAVYAGSLGSQVLKVCDQVAGRTGLRESEAIAEGYDALTIQESYWDHKVYYPHAQRVHLRLTGDRRTGRLLGAQLVGHRDSQVPKRIDVFAAALHHGATVAQLSDLDLTYAPPFSSPWDPVQMAAQAWERARARGE
jgi:NADPH-dependent 2,4-dienoyl-CoA reductase/sulfur reductase-like enzyme